MWKEGRGGGRLLSESMFVVKRHIVQQDETKKRDLVSTVCVMINCNKTLMIPKMINDVLSCRSSQKILMPHIHTHTQTFTHTHTSISVLRTLYAYRVYYYYKGVCVILHRCRCVRMCELTYS